MSRRSPLDRPALARLTPVMIPEIDIWRTAGVMMKRYGKDAVLEAARRADEFEAQGDRDGQRVWLRIITAIDALQNVQPGEARQ